jgi:IS1 family transposase
MIVGIHQPNYLPYLGFFDKIARSDIFVIYDDAQFNKYEFQHRNRIRIHDGWKWLTVPVIKEEMPINEIKIINETPKNKPHWSKIHFREIHANYAKTDYFSVYEEEIRKMYEKKYEKLVDLNMNLIKFLMKAFDIDVKLVYASEFGLKTNASQKNLDLVEAVGGDVYLSGPMGRDYLDLSLFEKKGIKVAFQDFKHPVYKQRYEGFVPNMAAIDTLFNVGEMPEGE